MNTIILDKKKYVVVEQERFEQLQLQAAQKTEPVKKLSLPKGRQHALKLIQKWAREK